MTTRAPKRLEACRGVVRITGDRLEIDGTACVYVARKEIAEGWFVEPNELYLKKRNGDEITIALWKSEAGPRILALLGFAPGQRALRLTLAAPAERVPFGNLAATLVAAALSPLVLSALFSTHYIATDRVWHKPVEGEVPPWVAITALLACALVLSLLLLRRGEVKVGADGISLRTLFGRRFYPYSYVGAVRAQRRIVRLEVTGRPVSLALGAWRFPGEPAFGEIKRQHTAFARRIRKARAASTGSDALPLADLDRAGRSIKAWRADLAKIARHANDGASYREKPLAADELAAVVESAGAPAERRVAAAVVLTDSAREHAARAVRVAINASADKDLSAALEHTAEGDLDQRVLRRRG